jgi:hypothetical protein
MDSNINGHQGQLPHGTHHSPRTATANGIHGARTQSASVNDYNQFFERCSTVEDERRRVQQDLLRELDTLRREYTNIRREYDLERRDRMEKQETLNEVRDQLVHAKNIMDASPFVFVIIDGDGAVFHDRLYALGKQGGEDAARLLRQEITTYLKNIYPDGKVENWNIMVQIVLNSEGLGRKLYAVRMVPHGPNDISAFGAAFSVAQPLFSFVDVGHGKEMADHKVRELLRAMVRVPACKHVIFGPAHDAGYIPVLQQYKNDTEVGHKLTLLETQPALAAFVELGFPRISFPTVFRDENLPMHTKTPTTAMASPLTRTVPLLGASGASGIVSSPSMSAAARSATSVPSTPDLSTLSIGTPEPTPAEASGGWQTAGPKPRVSVANPSKMIDISTPRKPPSSSKKYIILNKHNQRLDPVAGPRDVNAERRLHERMNASNMKLCNRYHLTGQCDIADCDYIHGERLPPAELNVLAIKARALRCSQGGYCRNIDCCVGHICRNTQNGVECTVLRCMFKDMHYGYDYKPAKRLMEDGTEVTV